MKTLLKYPFTFQYASIKPHASKTLIASLMLFTFQYASIKPVLAQPSNSVQVNLHFNMLLLNLVYLLIDICRKFIYISICFY